MRSEANFLNTTVPLYNILTYSLFITISLFYHTGSISIESCYQQLFGINNLLPPPNGPLAIPFVDGRGLRPSEVLRTRYWMLKGEPFYTANKHQEQMERGRG